MMLQKFKDFFHALEPLLILVLYVVLFIVTVISVLTSLVGCSTPTGIEGPPPIEWSGTLTAPETIFKPA